MLALFSVTFLILQKKKKSPIQTLKSSLLDNNVAENMIFELVTSAVERAFFLTVNMYDLVHVIDHFYLTLGQ
jgi:hypothetical protein